MDNIAEGLERGGNKEFRQYLAIAKRSLVEVKSQIYRALDRNYLTQNDFQDLLDRVESLIKRIASLMYYLKSSDYKGVKYKLKETLVEYERSQEPRTKN